MCFVMESLCGVQTWCCGVAVCDVGICDDSQVVFVCLGSGLVSVFCVERWSTVSV